MTISYKGAMAFNNTICNFGAFLLHMHRNGYLGASGQKSDPDIRSDDLNFL